MDVTQAGQAGLVGVRGRLGRKAADTIDDKTRFDGEKIAAVIGAFLFVSSAVHLVETLRRLRRG